MSHLYYGNKIRSRWRYWLRGRKEQLRCSSCRVHVIRVHPCIDDCPIMKLSATFMGALSTSSGPFGKLSISRKWNKRLGKRGNSFYKINFSTPLPLLNGNRCFRLPTFHTQPLIIICRVAFMGCGSRLNNNIVFISRNKLEVARDNEMWLKKGEKEATTMRTLIPDKKRRDDVITTCKLNEGGNDDKVQWRQRMKLHIF